MTHPIPDEALAQHLAVVGKTGSGKTFLAKSLVERLLDQSRRVVVIDPTGAWWGLRSNAAGDGAGYPVAVFGGEHADVPIAETSGPRLAEILGTRNLPAVIDLSEMLIGARHRFVEHFLEALHRFNRTPLHLVIDEADEVAPQNPMPETKRLLHQVDRVVRRGRIRGFRVMMITQRPAVLHKNCLTQANTLVAMRLTAPQDRKAIDDWVKGNADASEAKAVLDSLARLGRGEGWVWAPELGILKRAKFPPIRTFDSSRSPEDGESVAEPVNLAHVDLAEIRAELAPMDETDKPAAKVVQPSAAALKAARDEGFGAGRVAGFAQGWDAAISTIRGAVNEVENGGPTLPPDAGVAQRIEQPVPSRQVGGSSPPARTKIASGLNGSGDPTVGQGGLRRILVALAQCPAGLTNRQIGIRAGLSSKSGTFSTYISRARTNGWIEGVGRVAITAAGLKALGHYEPLPTGRALLDHWLAELGESGAARLLRVLADAYPRGLTNSEAGERANLSAHSGTFSTYLSRLRTLELVTGGRGEPLKASEDLF